MKRLLMAGSSCTRCCCCEEWLPGFISIYGGRQVVSASWAGRDDVVEDICTARALCPAECIIYRELK